MARVIKVWNDTTSAWEDVAVQQPDTSAFVSNSLISGSKGALITSTGSAVDDLTVGTDGFVLTADSAQTLGIKWAAAPASGIAETLLDAKGDLIVATAADTAARLAVGTNGHALVADSGATAGVKWAGVGKVLQVVSASKTNTFSSSSTTYTDITDLSVSITPVATTSKVLVIVQLTGQGTTGANVGQFRLVRGSTAIHVADADGNKTQAFGMVYMGINDMISTTGAVYLDSPSTTSSTTYKVQGKTTSNTFYVNRPDGTNNASTTTHGASSITVMEIGA